MAPVVPPALPAKRPLYLTISLVIALLFGLSGSMEGCNVVSSYNRDGAYLEAVTAEVHEDSDRELLNQAYERWSDTWEAARKRVFPLGVADLVLGFAMFVLASRAMAGRPGARPLLAQVVFAQAALVIGQHLMLGDVRQANLLRAATEMPVYYRMKGYDPSDPANQLALSYFTRILRAAGPVFMGLRTVCSLLVVVALVHPRSRRFYEAQPDAFSER